MQDRGQALHLIDCIKVLEWARCKKESVSLLKRHGAAKFWFVIVISEMRDLV